MLSASKISNSLLVIAVLIAFCSVEIAKINWQDSTGIGLGWVTIIQYTLMASAMLGIWYVGPKSNNWRDYRALLVVAITIRLLMIPMTPYTSNDIDRYMFDGKVTLEGHDPYSVSHNSDKVAQYRATWPTPSEHAKYTTIYPPGAISLFTIAAAGGPALAPLIWKSMLALASVTSLLVMMPILRRLQRLRHLSFFALSPILLFETGIGAHIDALTTLFVVLAIYMYQRMKFTSTGIMIGLGTIVKLFPVFLLVPLCFASFNMKRCFNIGASAMGVIFIGYAIAFLLGMHPIGSTTVFFEKWRNASPFIELINGYLTGQTLLYFILIVLTAGLGLIAISISCCSKLAAEDDSLVKAMQWTLSLPLLLSPVVFPWYLMPLVPLFTIKPSFFLFAWLTLIPLSYEVLNEFASSGLWQPSTWPIALLGMGMLVGFTIDRLLALKKIREVNFSCLK